MATPGILDLTVKEAKAGFFDRDVVLHAVDKAEARVLARSGGFIMTTARRSIRKARQKRLSEMTDQEKAWYKHQVERFKRGEIAVKPRRPDAASRPGEPPREHEYDDHPHSPLRRLIIFSYDGSTRSVVIGAAIFRTVFSKVFGKRAAGSKPPAPGVLEVGGDTRIGSKQITIAPRPFMVPALRKEQDRFHRGWDGAVTK